MRQPRSTRQIWARCSVRRALLKPTCKTQVGCAVPENRMGMVASRLIGNCRLAMNVPAQLSPPAIATPPKRWMASWYPSCRARLAICCVPASTCLAHNDTTRHNVRSSFVNPLTALCFLETSGWKTIPALCIRRPPPIWGKWYACARLKMPLSTLCDRKNRPQPCAHLTPSILQFSRC